MKEAFEGHQGSVLAAVVKQDGDVLFTAGDDGFIRGWALDDPLASESEVKLPISPPGSLRQVAALAGDSPAVRVRASDTPFLAETASSGSGGAGWGRFAAGDARA